MADFPYSGGMTGTATAASYAPESPQTAVERASQQLEGEIQNLSHNLDIVEQRLNPVLRPNHAGVENVPSGLGVADANDDVPHADRIHGNRRILASINERLLDVLQRLEV